MHYNFTRRALHSCGMVVLSIFSLQLNLVCDRAILKSTAQMMFFTGLLIGSFVSGIISDRYVVTLSLPKSRRQNFVCKFSKNVTSKLYHIENSKSRGQTM